MSGTFGKIIPILAVCAGILAGGTSLSSAGDVPEGVRAYQVSAEFEDVRFDLENAIVNRGLVIDYVSHIGDMLERTGQDVGSEKEVFSNAQAMLFCSADLSRKAMEADPANIAYCPYTLFVYETPGQPDMVTVGYRELATTGSEASRQAIGDVNALLEEIAMEAAGQ